MTSVSPKEARDNRQVIEFIKRRTLFVTSLDQIDLSNQISIGDDGLIFFMDTLESLGNRSVQLLIVRGCNITNRGVERISAFLQNPTTSRTLQKLFLSSNLIGDVGARTLGEALSKNNTLQLLTLQWNNISPAGGEALYQALEQSNNHTLEALAIHTEAEFRKETNTVTKDLQNRLDALLKPEIRSTRRNRSPTLQAVRFVSCSATSYKMNGNWCLQGKEEE